MKCNLSIPKCRERIVLFLAAATLLFVVGSLGYEFLKHYKTSSTAQIVLQDTSYADVLIILSEPYNKKQWSRVNAIVSGAALKSYDIEYLNKYVPEQLKKLGHPVIAFSIDRQKIVIYTEEGSKSP